MAMPPRYAHAERLALADALLSAGPDAPTLCAGWATRDLAAHLVLRERRPDAAAGIMLKPLAAHTKRVQDGLASGDYATLVAKVRSPQTWSLLRIGGIEEAMNISEFFVHHEDVRRAIPGWTPRELSPSYAQAILRRTRATTRLTVRKFPATIVVLAPGAEPFQAGAGGERIEVRGAPGELLMFFVGRQSAANVEFTGPAELAAKLRTAPFGI
jgi:uncharacterized protein (TIGR03085 family)